MSSPRPPSLRPPSWIVLGLCLGLAMVVVPFAWTMVSVSRASDVVGGLKQATVTAGKERHVGAALSSASIAALMIPPGILLSVVCGLALVRRRPRLERPGGADDSAPRLSGRAPRG
jgi:ABC-type spermidine/putrescine transport system permease subunit II